MTGRDEARVEQEAAKGPIAQKETWEARIRTGQITFGDLVTLKNWQTLPDDSPRRLLGEEFYDQALDVFRERQRGSGITARYRVDVAIFGAPGCGVCLTPEGSFVYTVIEREIGFDWSLGLVQLHRMDAMTRRARELWRTDLPIPHARPPAPTTDLKGADERPTTRKERDQTTPAAAKSQGADEGGRRLQSRSSRKSRRALTELRPHSERAYDVCSSIFSAVNLEKLNRQERRAEGEKLSREPSGEFVKRVGLIDPQVDAAELAFRTAAQRYAQVQYALGMAIGVAVLALLCAVIGGLFLEHDVPAWYGVSLVGGGFGAVVSVLQRMASGRLKLDYNAGSGMLRALGAVRPLVGAIFGMVLFAIVDGGWLPIDVSDNEPLSFYAVLGFLAGFNERFAQDMLVGSARQFSQQPEQPSTPTSSQSSKSERGGVEA